MSSRPTHLQTPTASRRNARRQTLGPVPHGRPAAPLPSLPTGSRANVSNNRRQSLAAPPGSISKDPPRNSRKSMIPRVGRENVIPNSPARSVASHVSTANSRRQSIGSTTAASRRRQSFVPTPNSTFRDPRPLTDKVFQGECARKVGQYLQANGYEHPLSAKTLRSPSSKDFGHIVTFLLRRIDPMFQQSHGSKLKLEDEIVLQFRALGYPFTISKTSVVAAGSPHAWPGLLAALAWLVDQLGIVGNQLPPDTPVSFVQTSDVTVAIDSVDDLELQSQNAFFEYLLDAYKAFLSDDMNEYEALRGLLTDRFARDDLFLENEVERIQNINANMAARMEDLREDVSGLPAYKAKRDDYLVDLEQFRDLIDKMDQHKQTLQLKIDERSSELKTTNEKLERMKQHIVDLKQQINAQAMSVEDLTKLETEHKGIKEAAERTQAILAQRKEALRVVEVELAQHLTQLDVVVGEYNAKVSELAVALGQSHWNTYKANISKQNLDSVYDSVAILGTDLPDTVLPRIQKQIEEVESEIKDQQANYQNALDESSFVAREIDETKAKLDVLREKANKAVLMLEQEKQAHLQKQGVRQREVSTLEQKVASLRDPVALEEQMAGFRQQCASLEAQLATAQDEHTHTIQDTQRQIHQALCLMQEHEALVSAKLQELEEFWQQHGSDLQPLALP